MGLLKAEITDELRAKRRIWDKNRRLRNKFNLTPDRKAKERAYKLAWYYANKDTYHRYYCKNKTAIIARVRSYYQKNKEKIKAHARDYYGKNIVSLRARNRSYSKTHKADNQRRLKKFYLKYPEKRLAWQRRWRAKNPEKVVIYAAKRRAMIRGVTVASDEAKIQQWMARLR